MGVQPPKNPNHSLTTTARTKPAATAHSANHHSKMPPSDRDPIVDQAEANAFFPSPFSLTQYVTSKTDFDGANYPNKFTGGKWRVLLIATQERYLAMEDGTLFSTSTPRASTSTSPPSPASP